MIVSAAANHMSLYMDTAIVSAAAKHTVSLYMDTMTIPATANHTVSLLGDSGGVVNSLDFCPASLKSLGCFYFRRVPSTQWKVVTVNLQILHCQL